MNAKNIFSKGLVLLIITALLVSAFGIEPVQKMTVSSYLEAQEPEEDIIPVETGTRASNRTVLLELFTQWNCGPCASANPAINDLLDIYGPSKLVMISTHTWWPSPNNDPFYLYNTPECDARISYYGVTGVPNPFFDGILDPTPGNPVARYNAYKNTIDTRLLVTSPIEISISGSYTSMDVNINVTVKTTGSVPSGTNLIKIGVTEDNNYAVGNNLEPLHRSVMRRMLAEDTLPVMLPGSEHSVLRSFSIDPVWNMNNIAVVAYVQHEDLGQSDDKMVLNAAQYDVIPQKILLVDDDESSHPLGNEDSYQEILSLGNYAFDTWVLDMAGSPTSADLMNYKAVIWETASTSTNTLTASDQSAISTYLDTSTGCVFVCGENIGAELNGTAFYNNYLHASLGNPNTKSLYVTGIAFDPISNNYVGMNLPILDTSPSEIFPVSGGSLTFLYSGGFNGSAVKAEHDQDSRVVYFAFLYFEAGDSDSGKGNVMKSVLEWLMFEQFSIHLEEGYNLISIPNIQMDPTLDAVFDSIKGEYDAISRFDVASTQDPWKHWVEVKPPELNDLSVIDHMMGFWIRVTKTGGTTFICNGTPPTGKLLLGLHTGWNMVGYPSQTDKLRDTALNNVQFGSDKDVDAIWTYDASTGLWKSLGPSDNFEVGRGYLIHSLKEIIWDVPLS